MRVLIADRNTWLLESIARTFAHQFTIQTGTTHEQCNELLERAAFDLVVVSEKLADGRGLQLLAQVACNSPETLRVLAARPSRLQLLKGKLGRFGLFRTVSYPINPQELLSALTLARTGLEVEVRAPTPAPISTPAPAPQAPEVPLKAAEVTVRAAASTPVPATVARPTAERISLTSAQALFTTNVPKRIGLKISSPTQPVRPSQTANIAPQPARAQLAPAESARVQPARGQFTPIEPARAQPARGQLTQAEPSRVPPVRGQPTLVEPSRVQAVRGQPTLVEPTRVQAVRVQLSQAALTRAQHPALSPARPQLVAAPPAPLESQAFQPMSAVPSALSSAALRNIGPISAGRSRQAPRSLPSVRADKSPARTKVALGMTSVLVFLVATVTLHRFDASAHVIHASAPPLAQVEKAVSVTPPSVAPASSTQAFQPPPHAAQYAQPKPDSTDPEAVPADPQLAASTTPIADPSSFGSEAYEVIYSN